MPKFRTMRMDTPDVATHLLENPERYLTPIGSFLRKFSLDELPQLWSVLKGDMSFVGPRPALHNQDDLIGLRTQKGVHRIIPGITGWAQVNGRDDIPIPVKVEYDEYYLHNRSFALDLKIICMTILKTMTARRSQTLSPLGKRSVDGCTIYLGIDREGGVVLLQPPEGGVIHII